MEKLIVNLKNASQTLFQWVNDHKVKANPDKCHFICSTNKK